MRVNVRRGNVFGGLVVFSAVALSMPATANVSSGSAPLTLSVGGTIAARPQWQNSSSSEITSLTFTFSGIAESSASANVNSDVSQAKLVNTLAATGDVSLTRPTGCSIGGTSVANGDIRLVSDVSGSSAEYDGSVSLTLSNNTLYNFSLRFLASGGYGAASGAVSCSGAGSLTYTY